jgi:hypothetical protein
VAETGESMTRKFMAAFRKLGRLGNLRMDFNFMPELRWRYGYIGALASMLVIGMALYFYFRKIKWL